MLTRTSGPMSWAIKMGNDRCRVIPTANEKRASAFYSQNPGLSRLTILISKTYWRRIALQRQTTKSQRTKESFIHWWEENAHLRRLRIMKSRIFEWLCDAASTKTAFLLVCFQGFFSWAEWTPVTRWRSTRIINEHIEYLLTQITILKLHLHNRIMLLNIISNSFLMKPFEDYKNSQALIRTSFRFLYSSPS